MVGLSHLAFRESVKRYLPEDAKVIWPTEMLSSFKLPNQKLNDASFLLKGEYEENMVPQILGNEEEPIRKSIKILKDWGAVGIDINMGCPVKKALKHNYGVSLMGDPGYAAEVTSMAVKASDLPVSVKFRAGIQKDESVLIDFVRGIESAGAKWVTLHPRTSAQKRRGRSDWSQIEFIKQKLSIPVIGNGDVQTKDCFKKMREETGCDQVMIGRALTARPWLLWQIGEELGFKPPKDFQGKEAPSTRQEEGEAFKEHLLFMIPLLFKHYDEVEALKKFRFYLRISHPWLEFGHQLIRLAAKCFSEEDCFSMVENFFSGPQRMSKTTLGAQ